jgi:hypothetical protein
MDYLLNLTLPWFKSQESHVLINLETWQTGMVSHSSPCLDSKLNSAGAEQGLAHKRLVPFLTKLKREECESGYMNYRERSLYLVLGHGDIFNIIKSLCIKLEKFSKQKVSSTYYEF